MSNCRAAPLVGIACLLSVWPACFVEAQPAVPVTYTGFMVDQYCYGLNRAGSAAVDGTNVITAPAAHSVHCMRDVPNCFNNGYYLAQKSNVSNTWQPRFLLDSASNARAIEFLSTYQGIDQPGKLTVIAVGTTTGTAAPGSAPILQNATITLCEPIGSPQCDGACIGTACNLYSIESGFTPSISGSLLLWGHMLCMAPSWGFLLPFGVFWARNMRWSGQKVFNAPIWFSFHWIGQSVGWAIMLLGFAFIFLSKAAHFSAIHEKIGLTVVIIGGLQPINAQLRHLAIVGHPGEPGPLRCAWEVLHKGLGYLAAALGATNAFIGVIHARNIGFQSVSMVAMCLLIPLVFLVTLFWICELYRLYRHFVPCEEDNGNFLQFIHQHVRGEEEKEKDQA